jgi:mono/diheme cytochrome c family protein
MMHRRTSVLAIAAGMIGELAWAARSGVEAEPRGKPVHDAHCVECHGPTG